jgi:M6 family metalloprotease-like protein
MRSIRFALLGAVTLCLAALSAPVPAAATGSAAVTPPSKCDMPAGSAEGKPNTTYSIRPVGTVRAVMLFVDFPDVPTTESTQPYFDLLAPARGWLHSASYGRLTLKIDRVDQWFRMPHASTDYDFQRGLTFQEQKAYIKDAVTAANASVDFSPYDIVYIVPPTAATAISFSPAFVGGPDGVRADGHLLGFGATFGQDIWISGWGYRVLAHETSHLFGLPDLYSFDPPTSNYWDTHRFVGGWDLMGYLASPTPDYFAWHKWHLGWLAGSQVRCLNATGRMTVLLSPVETAGQTKLAIVKTSPTSAFAVEVRTRQGADTGACRIGVLIYRITSNATGQGPIRVKPAASDDPTSVDACAPLYAAPFKVGEVMHAGSVSIKVTGRTGSNFTVRIVRS